MARSDALAAIAAELSTVSAIKAIYSPGTIAGVVKPIPDDISTSLPAALFLANDTPIVPGSWERQTWTVNGSIWTTRLPRGERYRELTDLVEPILGTYRQVSAAVKAADADIQSVVLTSFGAIAGEQWQRGEGAPWYFVLPFTLEVKVNRSVNYSIS